MVGKTPWHALGLDGLEGITEPFTITLADRDLAKQRSIMASCSKSTILVEGASDKGEGKRRPSSPVTSLVKMSGVTRRRERVGKQLLSLNGNPIEELRQAPLCGNLTEYSVGRAVRLFLRLQLQMSALFLLLFALAFVKVVDNAFRNAVRNACRAQLFSQYFQVVHNESSPWYGTCGYDGVNVRNFILPIPDGSKASGGLLAAVMSGPLTWTLGTCEEYSNETQYVIPVPVRRL